MRERRKREEFERLLLCVEISNYHILFIDYGTPPLRPRLEVSLLFLLSNLLLLSLRVLMRLIIFSY